MHVRNANRNRLLPIWTSTVPTGTWVTLAQGNVLGFKVISPVRQRMIAKIAIRQFAARTQDSIGANFRDWCEGTSSIADKIAHARQNVAEPQAKCR
jgi:hypothetical protein